MSRKVNIGRVGQRAGRQPENASSFAPLRIQERTAGDMTRRSQAWMVAKALTVAALIGVVMIGAVFVIGIGIAIWMGANRG
jgi:hypothetical protein